MSARRSCVVIRPFAALVDVGPTRYAPDLRLPEPRAFAGGESPPANLIAFPLVIALQLDLGVFAVLVSLRINPGQSLFWDNVELGGIEPPDRVPRLC